MSYERGDAMRHHPIPLDLPPLTGWKELPIQENGEQLLPLGAFSEHSDIATSATYAGEHSNSPYWREEYRLSGSLMTQFVRANVAERLRAAQALLPPNHYLIVLDSYRSLEVQDALFTHYTKRLRQLHADWSEEQLSTETQKYVSLPSYDASRPSPHNTGGAVDLALFTLPPVASERVCEIDWQLQNLRPTLVPDPTPAQEAYDPTWQKHYALEMERMGIVRRYGRLLDFGTSFDYGGAAAASNYYERQASTRALSSAETRALYSRRVLYAAMTGAGFAPYEHEWWHFNAPESQMGAKAAGLDGATYGAVALSAENRAFETMRRMHYQGTVHMQEATMEGRPLRVQDEVTNHLIELSEQALRTSGDPRMAHLLYEVAVIEPVA